MLLPKMPGKSYPPQGNEAATRQELSAAVLEAVTRTFNVAAPLIHNNPDLAICGIHLGDYYRRHFLELLTNENHKYFIGYARDQSAPAQQTCELGSLALWSIILPDVFWDRLDDAEKAAVAKTLLDWGTGWTQPHNWRWFNAMMLTFLDLNGYKTDAELIRSHVDHLILDHAGDGWYRDTSYDYYTVHVFHLYGAVWSRYYGRQKEPGRAAMLERHFNCFQKDYPMLFSRDGHVNMYGRSILYRLGASAGMPAAFIGGETPALDPGAARRISSSALLQFIGHPDFFQAGIPSLGFYGPFEPAIQPYSCSASPYWMFLSFIALALPETNPFWTAREDEGRWKELAGNVRSSCANGPGLLISNHGSSGASELRPGKAHNNDPNYCRLVYNTAFPWEANNEGGAISSAITLKSKGIDGKEGLPERIDFAGYKDGVFYRQATFAGFLPPHADMACIVIPGGEIRIDRLRKVRETTCFLGHFSMPHPHGRAPDVCRMEVDGHPCVTLKIPGRQLAVTNIMGWKQIGIRDNQGIHPEAASSSLLFLRTEDGDHRYGPVELLISVLLHKTDDTPWTNEELNPISGIAPLEETVPMHLGGMVVSLKNGEKHTVDFGGIDGACSHH